MADEGGMTKNQLKKAAKIAEAAKKKVSVNTKGIIKSNIFSSHMHLTIIIASI